MGWGLLLRTPEPRDLLFSGPVPPGPWLCNHPSQAGPGGSPGYPGLMWMRCSWGPVRCRTLRSSLRKRILGIFLFFGSVPQTHHGRQVTDKTLRKMICKRGVIALLFNISKLTMLKVTLIWVSPPCFLNCDVLSFLSSSHSTRAHPHPWYEPLNFHMPSQVSAPGDTALCTLCGGRPLPCH